MNKKINFTLKKIIDTLELRYVTVKSIVFFFVDNRVSRKAIL